ncbi:hypothetical protein LWI28_000573 [Acer negundo]|uniref:Uncharacterized protein n=1 Tax=Acer negundo TaxID=4023 RepID=A0AAD5ITK6_ACENE|nr:hypothetical protein LWI28_000573 [Acer negundo]
MGMRIGVLDAGHMVLCTTLECPTSATINTWVLSVVVLSNPCPLASPPSSNVHSQEMSLFEAPSCTLHVASHLPTVPTIMELTPSSPPTVAASGSAGSPPLPFIIALESFSSSTNDDSAVMVLHNSRLTSMQPLNR